LAVAVVWWVWQEAALGFRGAARYWLGRPRWHQDLDDAFAMARNSDPITHALVVAGVNGLAVENGMLRADGFPVREIEETLQTAERSSGDTVLGSVKLFLGAMLTYRPAPADRQRGLQLLTQVRDMWLRERTRMYLIPSADLVIAREKARLGERDGAIPVMRSAVEELFRTGQLGTCVVATAVLVETQLERGAENDIVEAKSAIEHLEGIPEYEGSAVWDIWSLRLRALVSPARGDEAVYRDLVSRHRTMAESLGFERHIAMAEAM